MASLSLLSPASSQDTVRMPERIQALPHGLPYCIACGYACAEPYARAGTRYAEHGTGDLLPFRCADGFSPLQINVLALALRANMRIISYAQLAQQLMSYFFLHQSPESVRAVVNRLSARNILHHHLARRGTLAGSHTQGGNARPVHSYPANVTRYPPRIPGRRTDSRTGR